MKDWNHTSREIFWMETTSFSVRNVIRKLMLSREHVLSACLRLWFALWGGLSLTLIRWWDSKSMIITSSRMFWTWSHIHKKVFLRKNTLTRNLMSIILMIIMNMNSEELLFTQEQQSKAIITLSFKKELEKRNGMNSMTRTSETLTQLKFHQNVSVVKKHSLAQTWCKWQQISGGMLILLFMRGKLEMYQNKKMVLLFSNLHHQLKFNFQQKKIHTCQSIQR